MIQDDSAVRQAFLTQAEWCHKLGSPFTALLCETLARHLTDASAVGRRVLGWPNDPTAKSDAVPLRLAGALHLLVLRQEVPFLAPLYPPNVLPSDDDLWHAVEAVLVTHEDVILPFLDETPQTNEVARSGVLYPGLVEIARRTKLPLALYEVGSSAGLNLNADRYRYKFGDAEEGDPVSPVLIAPHWQGHAPLAPLTIASRLGCDRNPLSASSRDDCERLLAYVWPDQPERLTRLSRALYLAQLHPVTVVKQDAAAFVEEQLPLEGPKGVCRVLMHSVAFQYFSEETKARIRAHMTEAGLVATRESPLAWLAYEVDPMMGGHALRLTLWPNGKEDLLATAHPHGAHVMWM